MTAKPLDNLTVVDMTHVLVGPYCTYQLAMLGAEVTKVESLKGDMVRGWGGSEEQLAKGLGTGFVPQNAGKKSVAVDIRQPEGAEIVRRLIQSADIFVENFQPGALAKYGLGFEDVESGHPALIYVSISAFGQTGPQGHRPGFDDVVQATSGYMANNERGDGPIRTGGPVLDYATGMHATSAILSALLMKDRTGQPQHVDIAMQDVAMLLINRNTSYSATTGTDLPPAGNRDDFLLGRFRTSDGMVMLAGYLPHHQRSILQALGLEDFAQLSGRQLRERASEIEQAAERVLATRTTKAWDAVFAEQEVVAGGVLPASEVIATGQPEARHLLRQVQSDAGTHAVTNAGYLINEAAFGVDGDVPTLGQHTDETLAELGYSEEATRALREARVVA